MASPGPATDRTIRVLFGHRRTPFDVKVTGHSGERRLGIKGSTGGSFLSLTRDQADALIKKLTGVSPHSRSCLPLSPAITTITGRLLTTTRREGAQRPGEKYPLVLLDSPLCVDPDKAMAGSIELVTDPQPSVAATLFDKRVIAQGRLSPQKEGTQTNIIMRVQSVKEAH